MTKVPDRLASWARALMVRASEVVRVCQVLAARLPRVEPYSIDEMFLDMDVPGDPLAVARELREAVRHVAKMPTCIGIGPTKTIAKLANALA